ncbi:MAG: GNAT family N-acetyltransferase [Spirochaetaceae bacterium]|nr:GNAT family N-acetyltransferase [Spirochaetaceae bacterium]
MSNIIVATDRLVVRELTIKDSELLYKYSNEEIAKAELPDEVLIDENNAALKIMEFINNNKTNKMPMVYAIELKCCNKLIGHIELSEIDKGIEIGYSIATEYQNKGYCSEIINPFLKSIKNIIGIIEIYGIAKYANEKSWKILEKSGFKLLNEGYYKQYFEGKYRTRIYSIVL